MLNRHKIREFHWFLLWITVLLVCLAGCKIPVEEETPEEPPSPVESISPQLDEPFRTTETIGPDGGSVILNDRNGLLYTLDIPPGVLADDMEISMTPVAAIPGLPFAEKFHVGVQFEPSGIYFSEPLVLTIDLPADADLSRLVLLGWRDEGEAVYLEPFASGSNQLVYLVSHFSGTSVFEGDAEKAAELVAEDGTVEARYKKKLAEVANAAQNVALVVCDDQPTKWDRNLCIINGDYTDKFIENFIPKAMAIFDEWLLAISPVVDRTADPRALRNLFREYYAWYSTTFGFLCGPNSGGCADFDDNFAGKLDAVRQPMAEAAIAEFQRELEECDDSGVISILYNDIIFALGSNQAGFGDNFGAVLGVPGDSDSIEKEIKRRFACRLRVNVTGFPGSFELNGPGIDVAVQLESSGDATNVAVQDVEVYLELKKHGCGHIDSLGTEATSRTTDQNGRTSSITILPGDCILPNQIELTVRVDDQIDVIQDAYLFIGKTTTLEAQIEDPCAQPVTNPNAAGSRVSMARSCEGIVITVSPDPVSLAPAQSQQFTATVTGATDPAVTWSATGGAIDPSGLYVAGETLGQFEVTATSDEDPTVSYSAVVTISDAGPADISGFYSAIGDLHEVWDDQTKDEIEDAGVAFGLDIVQTGNQVTVSAEVPGFSDILVYSGTITGNMISATSTNCETDPAETCNFSASVSMGDTGASISGRFDTMSPLGRNFFYYMEFTASLFAN
jgi:hypothetical protein